MAQTVAVKRGIPCEDGGDCPIFRSKFFQRLSRTSMGAVVKKFRKVNTLFGDCRPANCTLPNSNRAPGKQCKCAGGYIGDIMWNGAIAQGSCIPAPCYVPNSNLQSGFNCRCKDGYSGNIIWGGSRPSGPCMAAPCKVPNSDFAAGPDCHCLPGFYGEIKWNGSQVDGTCLQRPRCARNITHITWLMKTLEDSEGRICEAGRQLVWHGEECGGGLKIKWISVHSQPPGRPGLFPGEGEFMTTQTHAKLIQKRSFQLDSPFDWQILDGPVQFISSVASIHASTGQLFVLFLNIILFCCLCHCWLAAGYALRACLFPFCSQRMTNDGGYRKYLYWCYCDFIVMYFLGVRCCPLQQSAVIQPWCVTHCFKVDQQG